MISSLSGSLFRNVSTSGMTTSSGALCFAASLDTNSLTLTGCWMASQISKPISSNEKNLPALDAHDDGRTVLVRAEVIVGQRHD